MQRGARPPRSFTHISNRKSNPKVHLQQNSNHIRALFLEADGNVFCAGGDMKEMQNYTQEQANIDSFILYPFQVTVGYNGFSQSINRL